MPFERGISHRNGSTRAFRCWCSVHRNGSRLALLLALGRAQLLEENCCLPMRWWLKSDMYGGALPNKSASRAKYYNGGSEEQPPTTGVGSIPWIPTKRKAVKIHQQLDSNTEVTVFARETVAKPPPPELLELQRNGYVIMKDMLSKEQVEWRAGV